MHTKKKKKNRRAMSYALLWVLWNEINVKSDFSKSSRVFTLVPSSSTIVTKKLINLWNYVFLIKVLKILTHKKRTRKSTSVHMKHNGNG